MRFGIDASGWLNRRGFGRFTRNAVSALVANDFEADYVLLADRETAEAAKFPTHAHIAVVETSSGTAASQRGMRDVLRFSRATRRERLDAVLFPSLHTWFPTPGTPSLLGLHDTIADDHPRLALPTRRDRLRWSLKQRLALRQARVLFTVSAAARDALVRRHGIPEASLTIVPEAPDEAFRRRQRHEIAAVRAALGLGERYVLYAGGISPHKNVVGLVDAYAAYAARAPSAPPLVLAGALEDETFASSAGEVRERIATSGLDGRVLLPGFVSDETLACLYAGATVVVNPSLAEGFGLPAVEAAACGAALVLTDLPAHRETLDDSALFVPPGDTAALALALETVLADDDLRNRLAQAARERVAPLTWDAAGEALARLLRSAAGA